MNTNLIVTKAQKVLSNNIPLVSRLAFERKKFENWLQLEILKSLLERKPEVKIEKAYPGEATRCDFWFLDNDDNQNWLELKLCVTNYCRGTTPPYTRPITDQINSALRDLDKLSKIPAKHSRSVLLIAYPLPEIIDDKDCWTKHLAKISKSSKSVHEEFSTKLNQDGVETRMNGYLITI